MSKPKGLHPSRFIPLTKRSSSKRKGGWTLSERVGVQRRCNGVARRSDPCRGVTFRHKGLLGWRAGMTSDEGIAREVGELVQRVNALQVRRQRGRRGGWSSPGPPQASEGLG